MKNILYGGMAALLILASCGKEKVTPQKGNNGGNTPPDTTVTVSAYLTKALQTNEFVTDNLLTSYGGYRANTTTESSTSYEWYNASQIYADAAMVGIGKSAYATSMNKTFHWLDGMWDKGNVIGGYFAFSNLDGSGSSGTKYVDDNSLTGVVFLEAYEVSTDATTKAAYLTAAENTANWIINSGLWDNTFGGGFWWNTDKPVKPTQTNAIALQLFLRLYKITGKTLYHDWAVSVNTWLNTKMLGSNGLYIWQIEAGGKVDTQNFTYDNAIVVEDDILYADIMGDASYLAKAQGLANTMISVLWNSAHNVFIFNTTDIRMNGCYSGWASEAFIKLYEADKNSSWLTYAKGNIDAINVVLRDAASFGYYQYAGLDGAGRYTNLEGVDQAWMQRIQAMLSKYK
ncbi:glycoside hydrolase family 76 protein [Mucilaginibacter sp. BJC16-A38]|uniref:glycoside hydrolase family 76 protein n=1 Tax=Mucilaginibacter phenanthrenivorans TaxID=1234842 RepID=UPI00215730D5|nr:glycoside hydrolase family 76 protein [Mucilaginibacter phenanthrenivorans]MCR8556266.1 glycoside hydrolase family 76 protein [Mucilaginibacter phenanthrenivorans]